MAQKGRRVPELTDQQKLNRAFDAWLAITPLLTRRVYLMLANPRARGLQASQILELWNRACLAEGDAQAVVSPEDFHRTIAELIADGMFIREGAGIRPRVAVDPHG